MTLAGAGTAAGGQSLDVAYHQLLFPQVAAAAPVENVNAVYDGMTFQLTRGQLVLTAPVEGHSTALAFLGRGSIEIRPPNATESRQLALFTGKPEMEQAITAAVFRCADAAGFLASLGDQVRFRPGPGPPALQKLLDERGRIAQSSASVLPVRLLDALAADQPLPPSSTSLFFVEARAADGHWFAADFDPLRAGALRVHAVRVQPEPMAGSGPGATVDTRFDDTWTEFSPVGATRAEPPWRLGAYDIEAVPHGRSDLTLEETIQAQAAASGHRGLLLTLDGKYRVERAADAEGRPLPWLQAADPARAAPGSYAGNWLYLAWPQPVGPRQQVQFVLTVAAPRRLLMQASNKLPISMLPDLAWYPLSPFGPPVQPAQFRLRVASPLPLGAVMGSGTVANLHQGNAYMAVWHGASPLFSLMLNLQPAASVAVRSLQLADGKKLPLVLPEGRFQELSVAAAQTADAVTFYSAEFGDYPWPSLNLLVRPVHPPLDPITGRALWRAPATPSNLAAFLTVPSRVVTMPGRDAPSWPGLVLADPDWAIHGFIEGQNVSRVPPAASILAPSRVQLRLALAHAVAHQWWGDWVGWKTNQDRWLPEGLANGSANLFEEREFGAAAATATRLQWRAELTKPDPSGHIPDALGPLILGERLDSSYDPFGFALLALDKGGYIFAMLRAMLGEAEFRAAMHEFTATYAGRSPSTAEFQAVIEHHMSAAMDLAGNHRLDWFFDEYLRQTGIPHLAVAMRTVAQSSGGVRVELNVVNPDHWMGLLPIYAFRDAVHAQRALLPINRPEADAAIDLAFTPVRVAANPYNEMLVLVN